MKVIALVGHLYELAKRKIDLRRKMKKSSFGFLADEIVITE